MISRKRLTGSLPILISIMIMGGLVYFLPSSLWERAFQSLACLPCLYWVYVASIISINTGIIALRLQIMSSYGESKLSFTSAFRAIATTMLAGLCAPFIGGLLGQKWALRERGASLAVISYLLEKMIMAATGGLLALASTFILWSDSSFKRSLLSWPFIEKTIGCLFVITCLFLFFLTSKEKKKLYSFFEIQRVKSILKLCALSLASWILMASTFLAGLFYFLPSLDLLKGLSASLIVSFLASMPISISGWSVREFFSIQIFKFLGLPQSQALGLSLGIGLISLVAVILLGVVFTYRNYKISASTQAKQIQFSSRSVYPSLIKGFMYGACVFVFFQYSIPLGPVTLNFCPADIAACCGFVLGLSSLWNKRLSWRFISIRSFIISTLCLFALSFCIGWVRWGWSPWSLTKVIGWIIMVGYAVLSTLFIQQEGKKGMVRIVSLLAATLAFIILFEILAQWGAVLFTVPHLFKGSFTGFTNNRNAFGIQILITTILYYSFVYKPGRTRHAWIMALFLMGVQGTWSRSTQIVMGSIIVLALVSRAFRWKDLYRIGMYFIWINGLYFLGLYSTLFLATLSSGAFSLGSYSGDTSDHERWYTMYEGLKLWWSYPLWGAGLGAFVMKELTLKHTFLIIHNTPIWILAEFGLAGGVLLFKYVFQIIQGLYKKIGSLTYRSDYALWGILLGVGAMAMVHEILYQKIIWIALGLLLTQPKSESV